MTDKSQSFHQSFDEEFCTYLEFYLTNIFADLDDPAFNHFWCDGVSWAPYYNDAVNKEYLSYQKIAERQKIVTTAWMGNSGQDIYEMTIKLGKNALEKYQNQESMIECIPGKDVTDWIDIDPKSKTIEIRLK
jgi:hypothetical protein